MRMLTCAILLTSPVLYQSVWKLPSSISHLQSIILLLHGSNRVIVAPTEIWNMWQLGHVKCFQIYVPNPPRQSSGLVRMDNLQALTKAVNMKVSERVCKIIPNVKKYEDVWMIGSLPQLQVLHLGSNSITGGKKVESC